MASHPRFARRLSRCAHDLHAGGALDLPGQKRCVDFMIEAGSQGLCANFSEQFLLTDHERTVLTGAILDHVAGRVPVIVTTSHFARISAPSAAARRSRRGRRWS